jgi:hypothetical protein
LLRSLAYVFDVMGEAAPHERLESDASTRRVRSAKGSRRSKHVAIWRAALRAVLV